VGEAPLIAALFVAILSPLALEVAVNYHPRIPHRQLCITDLRTKADEYKFACGIKLRNVRNG
jgi:hypothetical protein